MIGPNIPFELDHHQPNQQLVSRVNKVQHLAVYHPYVSLFDDYHRPSGLYMDNVQRPVSQKYHSESVINELRAGESRVTQAAWLLITIWMLHQKSVGFQQPHPVALPPHLQSARHILFGTPKPDRLISRLSSRFDQQEQFQEPDYPSATTVEEARKLPDVRTYEEALAFAISNLPKSVYVNEKHHISGLMAAKKTPHGPELGENPVNYGMKPEHVNLIRQMGLLDYLQKGYPLPPNEFVKNWQNTIKNLCLDAQTHTLDDKPYTHNFETPITIYENEAMSKSGKSVAIVAFDDRSGQGDIITMGKRGHAYMDQVKDTGNMGTRGGKI